MRRGVPSLSSKFDNMATAATAVFARTRGRLSEFSQGGGEGEISNQTNSNSNGGVTTAVAVAPTPSSPSRPGRVAAVPIPIATVSVAHRSTKKCGKFSPFSPPYASVGRSPPNLFSPSPSGKDGLIEQVSDFSLASFVSCDCLERHNTGV